MKITWVDWNYVCRSNELGGLGVRSIREFNIREVVLANAGREGEFMV